MYVSSTVTGKNPHALFTTRVGQQKKKKKSIEKQNPI
jgi:hypothetical protein